MDSIEALATPAVADRHAILRCLGTIEIAWSPARREIDPTRLPRPIALLLRIVAAGLAGASVEQLMPALWPEHDARKWRRCLMVALRAVDEMVGVRGAVALDGDRIRVNEHALHVDSLAHEARLARVLNPFRQPSAADIEAARISIANCLDAAFLPEIEEAWVLAARMRIDDAVERAVQVTGAITPLRKE